MRSARPRVPCMPSAAPAPTALRANADIHSLLQQPIRLPIPSDVLNPQFGQTHRVKFGKTHHAEPKRNGRLHPRSCSRQQRHRLMGNSPPSPAKHKSAIEQPIRRLKKILDQQDWMVPFWENRLPDVKTKAIPMFVFPIVRRCPPPPGQTAPRQLSRTPQAVERPPGTQR